MLLTFFTLLTLMCRAYPPASHRHAIHTREGVLELGQEHPRTHWHIHRSFLQQQRLSTAAAATGGAKGYESQPCHEFHGLSSWGPLATHALYILSLAPAAQVKMPVFDLLLWLCSRASPHLS